MLSLESFAWKAVRYVCMDEPPWMTPTMILANCRCDELLEVRCDGGNGRVHQQRVHSCVALQVRLFNVPFFFAINLISSL